MDLHPNEPTWVDVLKLSVIALVAAIVVGKPWVDAKTGKASGWQLVQSLAACIIFGILTAGAQAEFQTPFLVTGSFAGVLALIGLPAIVATAKLVISGVVRYKFGVRVLDEPPEK